MSKVSTFTTKATPIDADSFPIVDSAASNASKRVLFSALKTWIYSLFGHTAASSSGGTQQRFYEDTDNGSNYVNLKAPATLGSNPDVTLPTSTGTLALTSDVDAAVVGLLDFKGSQDCSANPNYPSALKGDAYLVSVAGKIGGGSGVTVAVGDMFVCTNDNAGGSQAGVGTSWSVLEKNLVDPYVVGGTDVAVTDGGTGSSTAAGARTNLGTLAANSTNFVGRTTTGAAPTLTEFPSARDWGFHWNSNDNILYFVYNDADGGLRAVEMPSA